MTCWYKELAERDVSEREGERQRMGQILYVKGEVLKGMQSEEMFVWFTQRQTLPRSWKM